MTTTQFVSRPEGRIAYEAAGHGSLVVLVPGMGDLRSTYRFLVPQLVEAGFRAISMDLRGHGDSDTGFRSYGDVETASDIAALLEELGSSAVVVGNSMSSGSAAYLAAARPELVSGLVLTGPFVRNPPASLVQKVTLRVAMSRPWIAATWKSYVPSLYAGRRPDDFDDHLAAMVTALKRPGYGAAFARLIRQLDHAPVEAVLDRVTAPTLIVMGELDPDWKDPAAEARWITGTLHGELVMVPESGHYPAAQRPDLVGPAVAEFVAKVDASA